MMSAGRPPHRVNPERARRIHLARYGVLPDSHDQGVPLVDVVLMMFRRGATLAMAAQPSTCNGIE